MRLLDRWIRTVRARLAAGILAVLAAGLFVAAGDDPLAQFLLAGLLVGLLLVLLAVVVVRTAR